MDQKLIPLWISRISPSRPGLPAPWALIAGGLLSAALYVPFTITHGPTSNNIEGTLWSMDMHTWGFLLGTISNALIGIGLWLLRDHIAGGSRGARIALTVIVVALTADLLMNLAFRALGAPFAWLIIPPALVTAAVTARKWARPVLWALGVVTGAGAVLMLVPQENPGRFRRIPDIRLTHLHRWRSPLGSSWNTQQTVERLLAVTSTHGYPALRI